MRTPILLMTLSVWVMGASSGCASQTQVVKKVQSLPEPALAKDAPVQSYCYEPPEWPYVVLGELEIRTSDELLTAAMVDAFKDSAREMGGRAIVLQGRQPKNGKTVASNVTSYHALAVTPMDGEAPPEPDANAARCLPDSLKPRVSVSGQ